jgi:hypothetical protein
MPHISAICCPAMWGVFDNLRSWAKLLRPIKTAGALSERAPLLQSPDVKVAAVYNATGSHNVGSL